MWYFCALLGSFMQNNDAKISYLFHLVILMEKLMQYINITLEALYPLLKDWTIYSDLPLARWPFVWGGGVIRDYFCRHPCISVFKGGEIRAYLYRHPLRSVLWCSNLVLLLPPPESFSFGGGGNRAYWFLHPCNSVLGWWNSGLLFRHPLRFVLGWKNSGLSLPPPTSLTFGVVELGIIASTTCVIFM